MGLVAPMLLLTIFIVSPCTMPDGYLPQYANASLTDVKETIQTEVNGNTRTEILFQYEWGEGYRPDDFVHLPNATVTFKCDHGFESFAGYWSKTVSIKCGAEVGQCAS